MDKLFLPLSRRWLNINQIVEIRDLTYCRDVMSRYGQVVPESVSLVWVFHACQAPALPNPLILEGAEARLVLSIAGNLGWDTFTRAA